MSTLIRTTRLLATAALLGACSLAQAGLMGSTVSLEYTYRDSFTQDALAVGAGVEANCPVSNLCALAPFRTGSHQVDIGDTSITYRYEGDGVAADSAKVSTFYFGNLTGLDVANLVLTTDIVGLDPSRVTLDTDSVTVDMSRLALQPGSAFFRLSLETDTGNNVPEPGSMALVGLALAGLAAARRRA